MTTFRVLCVLWRNRALISVLVRRELGARYRASALGYLWSLLNPLFLLLIYSVVFTTIFQPRAAGINPYPLFLFSGLLPWLFLSGALLDASVTLVDNGPLLAKVVCPPEIFPMVTVLSHLVHHLLAIPVLVVALIACAAAGWHPFPWTLIFLPVTLIPWVLTTSGLALAVAALSVHFRDLRDLLGHLLNILFFASPIIYTLDGLEEWLRSILVLNPLASLVTVYRSAAFAAPLAAPLQWLIAMAVATGTWWFGCVVFSRLRETLVESV